MKELRIFYIHGLGGGTDSRIPSVLASHYASTQYAKADGAAVRVDVTVRTYPFDPAVASKQIQSWYEELNPNLVIGESMGANHAINLVGVPHLYVSPAMNAPYKIARYSWSAAIPGMTWLLNHFFRPTRPNRQTMDFRRSVMRNFRPLYECCQSRRRGACDTGDMHFAFFGDYDHYRKWGIVDPGQWNAHFGDSASYPGTHFMEQEFVDSLLIPKINEVLSITKTLAASRGEQASAY